MTRGLAPWEVWWADFDPLAGREDADLPPAIVVGAAFDCRLPNRLAFVVPGTTTDRRLPFHPPVTSLERATFAMCDQLESVSREGLCTKPFPGTSPSSAH